MDTLSELIETPPSNQDQDLDLFRYHTECHLNALTSDDPYDAIHQLENSIYLASQGIGLLAEKAEWLAHWTTLLAYGLWRIQEMDEFVGQLENVKSILERYKEEIDSGVSDRISKRVKSLARFPLTPQVAGPSGAAEAKFRFHPDSIFSRLDEPEGAEFDGEEQEQAMENEVEADDSHKASMPEITISKDELRTPSAQSKDEMQVDTERVDSTSSSLELDTFTTPATLVRKADKTPQITPGNRSPSGGEFLVTEAGGPAKQRRRHERPQGESLDSAPLGDAEMGDQSDESDVEPRVEGYRRMPEESPSPPPVLEIGVRVKATLAAHESLYLVGDHHALGNWNVRNGVKLTADDEGIYSGSFRLIGRNRSNLLEVKLAKIDAKGEEVWELVGKERRKIDIGDDAEEEVSFAWED